MGQHRSERPAHHARIATGVFVLVAVATLGGVLGGQLLGEHEGIVAECARHMRVSGDWVVPVFMEMPLIRKPPCPTG